MRSLVLVCLGGIFRSATEPEPAYRRIRAIGTAKATLGSRSRWPPHVASAIQTRCECNLLGPGVFVLVLSVQSVARMAYLSVQQRLCVRQLERDTYTNVQWHEMLEL